LVKQNATLTSGFIISTDAKTCSLNVILELLAKPKPKKQVNSGSESTTVNFKDATGILERLFMQLRKLPKPELVRTYK